MPCPSLLEAGCQGVDEERFSKLGRSQEKPLDQSGWVGSMKPTEKEKKCPDDPTAHIDLSQRRKSEAKPRIMLSAGGVWGQAGGGGDRRGEAAWAQHGYGGAAEGPPRREVGGAGRADKTVLLQVCSLQSEVGRIFPLPTLQLAQHGFDKIKVLRSIKRE